MTTPTDLVASAELQEMWDRVQIEKILTKYSRAFDRCDVAAAKDTYWPDALDDHPGYVGAAHGMCDHWNDLHRELFDDTQHYIMNNDIEISGDTAHVESYTIMAARKKGSFETLIVGGRYIRRLERRAGKWRIAAAVGTAHWASDPVAAEEIIGLSAASARDKSDFVYQRPLKVMRTHTSKDVVFGGQDNL